jgi:CheY-like chemotaxis protein/anti-sigma regulatory factor (Ser/Thr protein kinase)
VLGDISRLRQVLLNLIGNAIKFTELGGVTVCVRRAGELVTVAVQDSGIGIPEAEQERIFDAFHQIESSFDRRFTGTGLGLTISRELARAMRGDLVCRSQVGAGSTFTLTLCLPRAATPATVATVPGDLGASLRGHVLLAEDNEVNALVARSVLERAGLRVEVVEDGAAALERSTTAPLPDLVLMDCQMPVMDGFEATRRIRAFEQRGGRARLPIVALTANAYEADRERCLAAGMDEHLPKPFRDQELMAVLQRHLAPRELLTA